MFTNQQYPVICLIAFAVYIVCQGLIIVTAFILLSRSADNLCNSAKNRPT